jgi:hypothetical protein
MSLLNLLTDCLYSLSLLIVSTESAKPLLSRLHSRLLLRAVFRFPTLDVGDQLAVEKVLNPKP